MQLIVTDRESIERGIVVKSEYIVISIRAPDRRRARVRRTVGLRAALYLAFHDAEPARGFELPPEIELMTAAHAEQIWRFVEQHRPHIGAIDCHCEQGMSRSPAVAAALAEALGEDAESIIAESQPNRHVLQVLRESIARLNCES